MDILIVVLRWTWVLSQGVLIALLCSRKLWSRYRWFTGLLAVGLIQQVALLPFDHRSWIHVRVWAVFELIRFAVLCGATIELTRQMLEHHRKAARIAVGAFGLVFALGICIGTGAGALLAPAQTDLPVYVRIAMQGLRWVSFSTAGYLFGLALWFTAFPLPLRRNLELHRWLLALYGGLFPGWAILMTNLVTENHASRGVINVTMMAGCIICLWIWSVGFTWRGEQSPVPANPADRVSAQHDPGWRDLRESTNLQR